jgi:membrane associated rhomboid family serine protease
MFTHQDFMHIFFNMLALWFLGPQLERIVGRARFLALYLLSGLAGSVAILWLSAPGVAVLGASGAVFGLMGGLLVIAIRVKAELRMILIWLGINVVYTFAYPGISWQGHLGGFIGGVAIAAILIYVPGLARSARTPIDRDRVQIGALAAFGALMVLALALRVFFG